MPSLTRAELPAVSIDIRDRVGFAPKYIKARVTVERHEANRQLCVYGKDGDFKPISSCITLNGDKEPRTFWFEFKRVPAGRYNFVAEVERSLEKKFSMPVAVRVMAPGESLSEEMQ